MFRNIFNCDDSVDYLISNNPAVIKKEPIQSETSCSYELASLKGTGSLKKAEGQCVGRCNDAAGRAARLCGHQYQCPPCPLSSITGTAHRPLWPPRASLEATEPPPDNEIRGQTAGKL